MAKRGRSRREVEAGPGITGTQLQRARAISLHPILETPFGQLAFQREFTDYQIDAAEKVAQIYYDYAQTHGLKRWPVSPSFEVGIGHSPAFEDDEERERAEAAKRSFERLQDVISRFPLGLQFALDEFIIQKRVCPPGYLPQVKSALDILAASLGFKIRKKRLDKSNMVSP
jgi:hypothetical protein